MPNAYAGYTFGGQVNVSAYDLFSFGPDQLTFVPGCLPYYVGSYAWYAINYPYANTNSANDDITNWKQ